MLKRIDIQTDSREMFVNIDAHVKKTVLASKIQQGLVTIWVPHTTAAVTINENADPDVVRDILREMKHMVPHEHGYRHAEGNSAAHIKSSLFGPSISLILERGELVLGTWQSLYFCEFDGPRRRHFFVKIVEG